MPQGLHFASLPDSAITFRHGLIAYLTVAIDPFLILAVGYSFQRLKTKQLR